MNILLYKKYIERRDYMDFENNNSHNKLIEFYSSIDMTRSDVCVQGPTGPTGATGPRGATGSIGPTGAI
ncbi:collagen-like protein [Clostridium sp. SM-530-WT-3G]|uniref:collagen-like triple helix repeat-containing protein n=1 Tax=Clostridium sp. SM-530-WT-3G TaxID=2725303 RepID=UPI0024334B32|nr:collagen-like protein [Clostridium sp. SM-530-WT-3G]